MSYCIRLLSPVEAAPAAAEIAAALGAEGFDSQIQAAAADAGWERLELRVPGEDPLRATRSQRRGEENPVDEEIDAFLDLVLQAEETPATRQVEDALRRARQMILLEVPDTFPWGAGRTVADALVEFLADRTEALIQADGEGFYDREGNLLLAME
ncbi:MAG: hypothetical protein HY321_02665 [Armatimonadetes bacterium]|nr:hypothetical protein [Armatimonadota bacterium]